MAKKKKQTSTKASTPKKMQDAHQNNKRKGTAK